MRRRGIQAVLWDLDGTLVDSEGSFQAQAFSRAMQIVHNQTPPLNELGIPHTIGKTPDEIFDLGPTLRGTLTNVEEPAAFFDKVSLKRSLLLPVCLRY